MSKVKGAPDKLLAEWFWTDRWMGSSAFLLPMEARGLYREMLTQAWRRGAALPNDHEAIRRAVGCTAREWKRSWPKVERYWKVDGNLLVNETQKSVYEDALRIGKCRSKAGSKGGSKTQAKLQAKLQAKREAKREAKFKPPSPSPSPISKRTDERTTEPPPTAAAGLRTEPEPMNRLTAEAVDDWRERYGPGSGNGGQIAKAINLLILSNAVDKYHLRPAWDDVIRPAWRRYLRETTHPSPSAQNFRAHFADWLEGGKGAGGASRRLTVGDQALENARLAIEAHQGEDDA